MLRAPPSPFPRPIVVRPEFNKVKTSNDANNKLNGRRKSTFPPHTFQRKVYDPYCTLRSSWNRLVIVWMFASYVFVKFHSISLRRPPEEETHPRVWAGRSVLGQTVVMAGSTYQSDSKPANAYVKVLFFSIHTYLYCRGYVQCLYKWGGGYARLYYGFVFFFV